MRTSASTPSEVYMIYAKFSSVPDGNVCLNQLGELAVTKFAVEPVSTRWSKTGIVLTMQMQGVVPSWCC